MQFQPEFTPLIDELTNTVKSGLKDNLHSLYVYGSIANGTAVAGRSNLDVVFVMSRKGHKALDTFINTLKWRLMNRFPSITGVSIKVTSLAEVLTLESIFSWGFLIRQNCTCLTGDDLSESFGDFEPSWEISKYWNWNILDYIPEYRIKIAQAKTAELQVSYQQVIAKKMLRASYGLVMHKEKLWLDSPLDCARIFLKYHPEKSKDIQRLAILLGNKTIPKRSVISILDIYGTWLCKAYKKTEFRIG
jgi:hypothetical protein